MNKISVMCTVRFKNFSVMKNIIKQISLYFYKTKSILLKYNINTSKQYQDQFVLIKLKKKRSYKSTINGECGQIKEECNSYTYVYIHWDESLYLRTKHLYLEID